MQRLRFARRQLLFTASIASLLAVTGTTALATPVQYDFVSGTAMLEVEVNGSPVISLSAPVVGTFFTFDGMTPAVTDLEFLIQDSIYLGASLGMLDVLVTVTDAAGFSALASPTGPGTWDWAGGAFDVVADVVLSGGLGGGFSQQIVAQVPNADGTVLVVGNTATVHAERRSMFNFNHDGKTIEIFAAVDFVGVPEPGGLALLVAGALVLRKTLRGRL